MEKTKHVIFSLLCLLIVGTAGAQGSYDVRFETTKDPVCPDVSLFLDIEIKAATSANEFNLTEQNYRFSFNRDALENPTIDSELTLTGLVTHTPSPMGFSLYSAHSLTGSLDTVVSYNIELAGGDGYPLNADTWVPVGRLAFDIVDVNACLDLKWHSSADFPPTFIGELDNGVRATALENTFGAIASCISDLCNLPVELTNFSGEDEECEIHLAWQTATEENSDYFEVQRSWDGISFQNITRIEAAGNSNTVLNYNFTDTDIGLNNYYRLRQVDIDGAYEYSEVIKVSSDCFEPGILNDILEVYPNPTSRESNMYVKFYTTIDEAAQITVYDLTGRLMFEKPVALIAGPNLLHFSLNGLASGTYYLQVTGDRWHSSAQKIVKLDDN